MKAVLITELNLLCIHPRAVLVNERLPLAYIIDFKSNAALCPPNA